ncbi:hypothetical protein CLOM_g22314 [Closterium sp. NIES-68]|nr:hypothetical protein CLOM_g22314 [Closterium sp. NIES-68]GJP64408.1 hypothetical protein CLOP_g21405 [Closterium sp. NIES-67]
MAPPEFPPPGSFLAAAAKAEEEERDGNGQAAKALYEQLVGDEATRCPLAHIQLMRFLRRTEGMEAARKAFLAARKAPECTFQVYVASAYMELCHNKEPKVARNVFQLGMKKFGTYPSFVREFARFLSRLNDGKAMREVLQGAIASPAMPPHSLHQLWGELVECESLFGDLKSVREAQEGRRKALASAAGPGSAPEPELEARRAQRDLIDRFSYCGLLPCDASALPPDVEAGSAGLDGIQGRRRSDHNRVLEVGQGAAEGAVTTSDAEMQGERVAALAAGAAAPTAGESAQAAGGTAQAAGGTAGAAAATPAAAAVAAQASTGTGRGVKAEPQDSSASQGSGAQAPDLSSLSAALAAAAAVLMPRGGTAGGAAAAAAPAPGATGAAVNGEKGGGRQGGEIREGGQARVKEEPGGGEVPKAAAAGSAAATAAAAAAGAGAAGAGGVKDAGEKGEQQEKEGAAGPTGVKTHQFVASAAVEWKPGSGRKHGIAASSKLLEGLPRSLAHFISQLPPPIPGPYPDVDFIMSLVIQAELPPEALAAKSGGLHRAAAPGMAPGAPGAPGAGGGTGGGALLAGSKRKELEEEEMANAEARARKPPPVRDIFRLRQLQRARAGSSGTGSLSGGAGGTGGGGTASGSDRFSGGSM